MLAYFIALHFETRFALCKINSLTISSNIYISGIFQQYINVRCNIGSSKSSYEIQELLGILQIIGSMIFPYAHWNVKTIKNGLDSRSSNYSANCLWGKILFALFSDPSQEVEIFSRFYSKQAYKHIILLWILYKILLIRIYSIDL